MEIRKDSVLNMHKLISRHENDEETLIGRQDIAHYIILPTFAVDIIEMLDSGKTIAEVEAIMEERFGEPVDVLSFALDLMVEYRFVHLVDGVEVEPPLARKDHLPWISQRMGQFFFNRIAYGLYGLLFLTGLFISLLHTEYFPKYDDIFMFRSAAGSFLVTFISGWFFLCMHEIAHLMAARSLGVGSRFALSHRLTFLVAETDMTSIVMIPRQRRYRAYLAGMAWDVSQYGISVLIQYFNSLGWISVPESVILYLKMLNFTILARVGWQFMFYMRTDMYYVLTNYFDCKNLMGNTHLFLRQKFLKKRWTARQQAEWDAASEGERRMVRRYVVFYVCGVALAILFFLYFTLPQVIEYIRRIASGMKGHAVTSAPFIDGVLMIAVTLLPLSILVVSWIRTYLSRRADRLRRANLAS